MRARKTNLAIENDALRNQIRDLKENLRAANTRAAYWADEVGRLRAVIAGIRTELLKELQS